MTMIGISPSDFITIPALARSVYRKCQNSTGDFKALAEQVNSLSAVLDEAENLFPHQQRPEAAPRAISASSTLRLDASQRERLETLRNCCRKILDDLDAVLQKYSSLGTDNPRKRDRIQWPTDDVGTLQTRLISSTVMLASFNATVANSALQSKLDGLLTEVRRERRTTILSVQSIKSVSSVDGEAWRQVRKELEGFGLSPSILNEHRDLVINSILDATNAKTTGQNVCQSAEVRKAVVSPSIFRPTSRAHLRQKSESVVRLDLLPGPAPVQSPGQLFEKVTRLAWAKLPLLSENIQSAAETAVYKIFHSGSEAQRKQRLVQWQKCHLPTNQLLQRSELTVLLLDQEEGGNSTLLEQMMQARADEYTIKERRSFKPVIFSHIIQTMKKILDTMGSALDPQTERHCRSLIPLDPQQIRAQTLPECVGAAMNKLWWDPHLQNNFRDYTSISSAVYYFKELPRISASNYVPVPEDILQATTTTISGITERTLVYGDLSCRFLDVEWPETPTKGWIECFEQVHTIIYSLDISRYDEGKPPELRLPAELDQFGMICNLPAFRQTPLLLNLNNTDRFQRKIPGAPLKYYLPMYQGPNDPSASLNYIRKQFNRYNNDYKMRDFYINFSNNDDEARRFDFVRKSIEAILLNSNVASALT